MRTRLSLLTVASTLGAALPAFAQAPAPAPMYAPAPAPAPMMAPAPAPAPEAAVMPAAPVMAPKAADDMTGSVGFGVGVVAGSTTLIAPNTGNLMMKYWMSDVMAIVPRLDFSFNKAKNVDATWGFAPSVLADFTLLKGLDTRFSAGVGLGIALAKGQAPAATPSTDTYVDIFVPAQLGVEHFFTRWFAMSIAANFRVFNFAKQGDGWNLGLALNNTSYMGSLFFYTN